jgi:phosphate transport system substrate-binding protein
MRRIFALIAMAMFAWTAAEAQNISGGGATFPYPVYSKWAAAYKQKTGVGLNYQAIGSGGGIKQIKSKTVTFGASDMPLTPEELKGSGLLQFPMIMGGVVLVVNLKGIGSGEITLDGPTLAGVYPGEITTWDDSKIKALNATVNLPGKAIAVVHRSDGSGTGFLFTDYLSKVSPAWKEKVGASTSVSWPVGLGAKGNAGVANQTMQTDGAIGFVEYAYAKQNKMTCTKMINAEGNAVAPSLKTFQAAAEHADWTHSTGFHVVLTNQPGADSWPITGASFILVHQKVDKPAVVLTALKFFDWAYQHGARIAEDLDYVPIPGSIAKLVEASWSEIKDGSGKSIW